LRHSIGLIFAGILIAALTACSSEQPESAGKTEVMSQPVISTEPVTLKFYAYVSKMTEDNFNKTIAQLVKSKYPHITLEFAAGERGSLDEKVAAGTVPDIIFTANNIYPSVKRLNIPMDMTEQIKRHKLDLQHFNPITLETIRKMEGGRSMPAVPFSNNAGALFYNKDIFDKMAIPYPVNGMTWDQIIDLARKMTRTMDGSPYIGWSPGQPDAISYPYEAKSLVDPKTNKVMIDTPMYQKVFSLMKQIYDLPGYLGGDKGDQFNYSAADFISKQRLAMIGEWISEILLQLAEAEAKGAAPNWDLVTIPNFADNKGKGRDDHTAFLILSNTSPHKDQAMQVIKLLTSKESQLIQSRSGRVPASGDPEVIKQFGQDIPQLRNKNLSAIFEYPLTPAIEYTIYDTDILSILRGIRKEVAVNKKDVNTALREAQEQAEKKMDELVKAYK
jgi:multiple sugar transport system substrate-binding protein